MFLHEYVSENQLACQNATSVNSPLVENNSTSVSSKAGSLPPENDLRTVAFYKPVKNEVLRSKTNEYKVLGDLAKGCYGSVVKCRDKCFNMNVAIKILKNHPSSFRQGLKETYILTKINKKNAALHHIVHFYERFLYKDNTCLVFELLGMNLYELVRRNNYMSLPLKFVRPLLQQMLTALEKLNEVGVIHTDVKPDNIMLVDHIQHPFRIKLIDFGSAISTNHTECNIHLQPRYYRAPEVILGLPVTEAIDMWSLGCIAAELFLAATLFPAPSEFDLMRLMSNLLGLPPQRMLEAAPKTLKYFVRDADTKADTESITSFRWRLKTGQEYEAQTAVKSTDYRRHNCICLDDIRKVNEPEDSDAWQLQAEKTDRKVFIDLLERMLIIDQRDRITPSEALQHDFIQLAHLSCYAHCDNVRHSVNMMEACLQEEDNVCLTSRFKEFPIEIPTSKAASEEIKPLLSPIPINIELDQVEEQPMLSTTVPLKNISSCNQDIRSPGSSTTSTKHKSNVKRFPGGQRNKQFDPA